MLFLGKTLEQLAKGYKLHYLLSGPTVANDRTQNTALSTSPRIRPHRTVSTYILF